MAYLSFINNQLKVNNLLITSKSLNLYSKHLCFEHFQHQKSLNGLFEFCKQSAESKQSADHIKFPKFSYLTTLHYISQVISQCLCPQYTNDDGSNVSGSQACPLRGRQKQDVLLLLALHKLRNCFSIQRPCINQSFLRILTLLKVLKSCNLPTLFMALRIECHKTKGPYEPTIMHLFLINTFTCAYPSGLWMVILENISPPKLMKINWISFHCRSCDQFPL